MSLAKTIKTMVDDDYAISFSKEGFSVDGIRISVTKDSVNTRTIIPEDKLKSSNLSTDELFTTIIEHLGFHIRR